MDSLALAHQAIAVAGLACLFPAAFGLLVWSACRERKPASIWRKRG